MARDRIRQWCVWPGSRGSMMAQAARDFIFWPAMTVAAQDSIHALGRPNATDLGLRCHMPKGWVEGRSDPTNAGLLGQGAATLTMDLTAGDGLDGDALLAAVERAKQQLRLAASLQNLSHDPSSGLISFRVQNQTGHKLLSGFPEGRRMFVNIKAYRGVSLVYQLNPYDASAGTLKGLPSSYSPSSPPLDADERHRDELVYEMHPTSILTDEQKTFPLRVGHRTIQGQPDSASGVSHRRGGRTAGGAGVAGQSRPELVQRRGVCRWL